MLGVRTRLTLVPGIHSFPACLKQVKLQSIEIRGKSHFLTPFHSRAKKLHYTEGKLQMKNK